MTTISYKRHALLTLAQVLWTTKPPLTVGCLLSFIESIVIGGILFESEVLCSITLIVVLFLLP